MFFRWNGNEVPADIPCKFIDRYICNLDAITEKTDKLFLFAVDQKIEHLNADFSGTSIHSDAANPEHIFIKARDGRVGALATHFGLIARYAKKYNTIKYIVKLNAKTNLVSAEVADPLSTQLWTVENAILLAHNGLPIKGIGYTIYLGSQYESVMLHQAAQVVAQAHAHGLVAILWIYPRGKSIADEKDEHIIAGAAGVANALGADFVKIHPPQNEKKADNFSPIIQAAGNTRVICSGGPAVEVNQFLQTVHQQLSVGKTSGVAVGRNLISRSIPQAIALSLALRALVYENKPLQAAQALYEKYSYDTN